MTDWTQAGRTEAVELRVELAVREADGTVITLLWDRLANLLAVVVVDSRRGESFELVIEPDERPLDVFYHPYAAAAARGLDPADGRTRRELSVAAWLAAEGGR
jgi:hypothetical protein